MYVNPILLGVLVTVGFEMFALIVWAVYQNYRRRK